MQASMVIKSRDSVYSQTSLTINIIYQQLTSRVVFVLAGNLQLKSRTRSLGANVLQMGDAIVIASIITSGSNEESDRTSIVWNGTWENVSAMVANIRLYGE